MIMYSRKSSIGIFAALAGVAAGLLATPGTAMAQRPPKGDDGLFRLDLPAELRRSAAASIPLIQKSADAFKDRTAASCVSCHHQSLPMMVLGIARERGIKVDEARASSQREYVTGLFEKMRPILEKARTDKAADHELDMITVDPSITVGYSLAGMAAEKIKPNATTDLVAAYLMRKQLADGRFPVFACRPPHEGSEFTSTALAVRGISVYAPKSIDKEAEQVILKARKWLIANRPKTGEDAAFRLFGLKWSGAPRTDIDVAVKDLLATQKDDGGWPQLSDMKSDAYATGLTLVALNLAGGLPTSDSAYMKGSMWLFMNHKEDGTWQVVKRATPVQPFFDTEFPHGNDQYISMAGTCWATMALALHSPVIPESPTRTQAVSVR